MLETSLRESRVRLPTIVMLETWLRESRVPLPATSQLCFCSLIFVDYVLILYYDYQMAFSPISSVVYALRLVRLISCCYAVPQCSMHPNRCLLVPGLPIPFGFPFDLACPVLACITLFYWSSLCSCRATVRIPSSYICIPSSSCYRASFLTDNTSGISCHVRCFIQHDVDNSRVIAGYSLNFL
jgi:hypothetical protein